MLQLVIGTLRYHGGRTALSVLALAAAIAVMLLFEGFRSGLWGQLRAMPEQLGADLVLSQSGVANFAAARSSLPQKTRRAALNVEGVASAHALTSLPIIFERHDVATPVQVIAYVDVGAPARLAAGRHIDGPREVVIDRSIAIDHALAVGDTLEVLGWEFEVVGISSGTAAMFTPAVFARYLDLVELYASGDLPDEVASDTPLLSYMLVRLEDDAQPDVVREGRVDRHAEPRQALLGVDVEARRHVDVDEDLAGDVRLGGEVFAEERQVGGVVLGGGHGLVGAPQLGVDQPAVVPVVAGEEANLGQLVESIPHGGSGGNAERVDHVGLSPGALVGELLPELHTLGSVVGTELLVEHPHPHRRAVFVEVAEARAVVGVVAVGQQGREVAGFLEVLDVEVPLAVDRAEGPHLGVGGRGLPDRRGPLREVGAPLADVVELVGDVQVDPRHRQAGVDHHVAAGAVVAVTDDRVVVVVGGDEGGALVVLDQVDVVVVVGSGEVGELRGPEAQLVDLNVPRELHGLEHRLSLGRLVGRVVGVVVHVERARGGRQRVGKPPRARHPPCVVVAVVRGLRLGGGEGEQQQGHGTDLGFRTRPAVGIAREARERPSPRVGR